MLFLTIRLTMWFHKWRTRTFREWCLRLPCSAAVVAGSAALAVRDSYHAKTTNLNDRGQNCSSFHLLGKNRGPQKRRSAVIDALPCSGGMPEVVGNDERMGECGAWLVPLGVCCRIGQYFLLTASENWPIL